jgi:hypothetical protein
MLDRAVCRPVGTSRYVGFYMSLVKLQLCNFVIPTAEYAGNSLLKMGKDCAKYVEILNC